jgi:sec-independent protein translocase protein TatB
LKLGFSELVVILVVAMLVIGPDKLPYYARNAGKALKGFRRELNQTTEEVRETLDESMGDVIAPIREMKQGAEALRQEGKNAVKDVFDPFAEPEKKEGGD